MQRITMTPGALRIREAAARLFYERGIHAVGVDLISAEAGVTKKTLYDRFGSKDQLVVEYLAERDERWRDFVTHRIAATEPGAGQRALAVFDASKAWMEASSPKGCSMVNAHAEISDPSHPAHAVITGQKAWMLGLFTDLVREAVPESATHLGRSLMLLHEGALVAHGMKTFPDPIGHARDQARQLIAGAPTAAGKP